MFLYGAGGHAKVIKEILEAQGTVVEGIIDDNPVLNDFMGMPVRHQMIDVKEVIVSIGYNNVRRKVAERIASEVTFGTAVHPTAIVSPSATLGEGTVVMQGAIIQVETKVGKHCIVNTGASIDHECVLGDYVHVSPHATLCGDVQVGEGTWIGAGAVVIPGVRIGKWCVIGAGSVVLRDVPDGVVAVGTPCNIVKR